MPKFTLLVATFIISFSLTAQTSYDLNRNFHRDSALSRYKKLFQEVSLNHPGFYRFHSKPSMDAYIDSVLHTMTADSVSGWELYRTIKPIVARIGCLHTAFTLSKQHDQWIDTLPNLLPFQLLFRDNKAWIVKNLSTNQSITPGTAITHINGRSMDELLQVILPAIPSDGYNMTMKYLALHHDFARWYRAMVEQPAKFTVRVVRDGQSEDLVVPAASRKNMAGDGFLEELTYKKPLEYHIDNGIGKLAIHSFEKTAMKAGHQRFKKFIRSAFKDLKQQQVQNLVIDLRYNTGGTDGNAAYLSRFFFDKPYRYWDRIEVTEAIAKEIKGVYKLFFKKPVHKDSMWLWKKSWYTSEFNYYQTQQPAKNHYTGKVYVLVNGFCMSACAEVASILSYNKKVILIGEETGGGFQGNTSGMMPEVKTFGNFMLTIPLLKYVTAVDQQMNFGRGVFPDHPVVPTVEEVINKKNVAMLYTLELIRTASATHQ